jgi:hypothetical protein
MKWKSFTGIVLIVGYHWEIGRSVIERFPAILDCMEWVKNQATSRDLYERHWLFVFLSVSLIAEEPDSIGALALYGEFRKVRGLQR